MGDLLRIDLTTRHVHGRDRAAGAHQGAHRGQGHRHALSLRGGRPRGRPAEPAGEAHLRLRAHGRHVDARQQPLRVYFASPLTNGYCEAYSGGNLAPQFAKTGFKVVIVEGKADGPVYLEISEDGVRFHSAEDLWGLDAFEAEDKILERTEHKKAQACVIGQAGENLVRFACVNNNKWHQLGRGGPGAVFGSKNLKGIVWHGDKQGRGRAAGRLQGRRQGPCRAHQGRPRRRRLPARRHAEHGAHHERQERLPDALLAQGHPRGLREHHRRDHAREARHPQRGVPAVRHEVRQAQLRLRGPAQGSRVRGSRVRDRLRLRRPLRDRRLRRADVAQRPLRPLGSRHDDGGQPLRPGDRGVAARPDRREDGLRRPRLRRRVPAQDVLPRGHRRHLGRGHPARSRRSTASRASPCTARAWSRRATSRGP